MSTIDPKPPRKQRQDKFKSQPTPNGTERLKTVVRRLPPNLPGDIFWQSVQAWVTDDTVTWKSYHPGKLRTKRVNKEGIPSRAYIAFKNEAQVATFSRAYDGHLFRDKAGNESHAIVEYAPFQKVPAEKKKNDARNNTIDKDEDYLSFLETLKGAPKTESVSLETLIAASHPPPHPTTTPLLEALKAEKSAQKDKEAILRNHAHYKDVIVSGASSKKEDAKKKVPIAAVPIQAAKLPETPAPSSKRAKKAAVAAAQKAQDGLGKGSPAGGGGGVPSSSAKPPAQAPASSAGHTPRHRPPREHGRSHPAKGSDASSAPAPASGSGSGPAPGPTPTPAVTTENVALVSPAGGPAPAHGQNQRKNRPMVGIGRHFEAALTGTGVGVSPAPASGSSDRKRRDKGGDSGAGAGAGSTEPSSVSKGKQKHREERAHPPPEVVPTSILQRPAEVGSPSTSPGVVIVQPSVSPRATEGLAGRGEGGAGAGAAPAPASGAGGPGAGAGPGGRGNARRGRGRGSRGHRGG
ncbi:hypothetical protein OG21DRAFT_1080389 [Imleria badia]|nr:hypothetical protein OG21DRAFT_1080389 [Imleria badia]